MNASQILEEEHKVILTVLAVLDRLVEKTRGEGRLPADDARETVRFFREFADKCHHAKEEDTLFPAMEEHGFSREQGPTAVMRMEHVMGRNLVKGMAEVLEAAAGGEAKARNVFCARAEEFIALLSQHIQKEDHCLFPMACQALGASHQCDLLESFRRIEKDAGGTRHREFLAAARALCERYGVTPVEEDDLPATRTEFLKK